MKKYRIYYGLCEDVQAKNIDAVKSYVDNKIQQFFPVDTVTIIEVLDDNLHVPVCSRRLIEDDYAPWEESRYFQNRDYVIRYQLGPVESEPFQGTLMQAMDYADSKIGDYGCRDVDVCPVVDGEVLPSVCNRLWLGDFVISEPGFPGFQAWQNSPNI